MFAHLPFIDLTNPPAVRIRTQLKLEVEHPRSFKTFGNRGLWPFKSIKSVVGLLNISDGALVGWFVGRSVVRGRRTIELGCRSFPQVPIRGRGGGGYKSFPRIITLKAKKVNIIMM
ncbi:hypothetical protein CEXT_150301 [Caerostris extrusa]|uniref:Uncharacterized protein n=1 Tax=Caerostris extrusa TaxID=172846 RepID=A0AAV4NBN2_CAEEX|nr:hypothetical protein CEXT_150301 [Caerostris extrusa]